MYRNSVDAFTQLLSPAVNRISVKSGRMQNGIEHCVVQVMLAGGEEYRIEAYGEEAEELCKVAREYSARLLMH
ncbi:MAG: hypothetical protein AB1351_11550 [Thermoproteota archaeon]